MKVLIAVSGMREESCGDPVAAVTSYPWPTEAAFRVLTVAPPVHPPVAGLIPGAFDIADVQRTADTMADNAAAIAAAQLKDRGFVAEGVSQEGEASSAIVEYAKTWGADLIVVGSCDRPAIERFFVGSVCQSVVKHGPCSVLVAKSS